MNKEKDFIIGKNVIKTYSTKNVQKNALDCIDFEIPKGSLTVITGPSGAGKTTLLNILGGMDSLTAGNLKVFGKDISKATKKELTNYRRIDVGFVFQFYNLMPNLTVKENVELAVEICPKSLNPSRILKSLGLENEMNSFPSQISGGQQQRTSIARAIAKNPKVLLCDEPTGALDSMTGKEVLKILRWLATEKNKTVIIVTHNAMIKEIADYTLTIKNGKITDATKVAHPKKVESLDW